MLIFLEWFSETITHLIAAHKDNNTIFQYSLVLLSIRKVLINRTLVKMKHSMLHKFIKCISSHFKL